MSKKHYKHLSELNEVDEVLKYADKVLSTKYVAISNPSAAPKIIAASITTVAGTGAAIVGTTIAGGTMAGAGVAGGAVAIAGFEGLAAAAGTAGATAGGIALAPVAIPVVLIGGIGYLIFKNKKMKQLNEALQSRLEKAVEKQNKIIKEYNELLNEQKSATRKRIKDDEAIIKQQAQKIDELLAMMKSLELVINKMTEQLTA